MTNNRAMELLYDSEASLRLVDHELDALREFTDGVQENIAPPAAPGEPTPTPASHRNNGAAKPPRIIPFLKATVDRSAARVHASSACASIISSTAMPRIQSIYARRPGGGRMASADDLNGDVEVDVLTHRLPDGAVLVA